jgi:lipopolysaccharide/colanic/teichoic acid biosynthesis glycosyltransferase
MSLIRIIDFLAATFGLILLSPLILVITIILFFEHRKPFFVQQRVGKDQKPFTLIKFRSMSPKASNLPTHEISADLITKTGKFIRATKLDELPQLWNVLKGEMSLVGPRPCLPTQEELISERALRGVFSLRPGITGPAQVQNIDMSTPKKLAEEDSKMVNNLKVGDYFKFVLMTVSGSGQGDKVRD